MMFEGGKAHFVDHTPFLICKANVCDNALLLEGFL